MKVNFQIIHSFDDNVNLKENLLSFLKETFDESTTMTIEIEEKQDKIEEWSIFNWVEVKYNYLSENNKYIAGFNLEVPEGNIAIISEFGQKLQDDDNIYLILKYNDEVTQKEYKNYAKEIYDLEMGLREIISFIFLNSYKEDYYNLLRETRVKVQPLDKNNIPNKEYYESHFENEFFFLLFSDYIKISELKELKSLDLIEIITNSNDYDDLKQKIQNRGIVKKEYQDFLAGIKENLDPIENLRNCIAHNRSFTDKIINNYVKVKKILGDKIDNFWNEVKNEN
jgi:hypothetical protein